MSHRAIDMASLEMGRRVAQRLRHDPTLVDFARANLARWKAMNADAPRLLDCYAEWESILSTSVDEISRVLCDEGDEGQRLRQSSPFAGVLSPQEVWEIKRKARAESMGNDQSAA